MKFAPLAFLFAALTSASALVNYKLSSDEVDPSFCSGTVPSKSLSGYFSVQGSADDADLSKEYFYWFFESQNDPANSPFIIWLTGGPGCSSTLALLFENGPCKVNDSGSATVSNPYSWNTNSNILWLDQPAGVGFSYGTESDSNEEMVGEDAYYFVQNFMKAHPEYATRPLFIFGESYGGHYAPSIAHRILEGNNDLQAGAIKLNLAGLGVGNGLTQPEVQYSYYAEMAFNNSHHIETVTESVFDKMVAATPQCISMIDKCNKSGGLSCSTAYSFCNAQLTSPYYSTGLNPYDIRKECGSDPLCYDFDNIDTFLTTPSTLSALHVSSQASSWVSCNNAVNADFKDDWMLNYDPFVADLLDAGLPVLIYAGDVDFICNYLGNQAWTEALEWGGKAAFNGATQKAWEGGAGLVKSAGGLTFMIVSDAGHMVPYDKPKEALAMVNQFLGGGF